MAKKKRNNPQAKQPVEPKPQFEYKPFPVEEISPEGWQLAQEYLDMCDIGGLARITGAEAKRERRLKERLSKITYRHFTAALVRLQRGETPPA